MRENPFFHIPKKLIIQRIICKWTIKRLESGDPIYSTNFPQNQKPEYEKENSIKNLCIRSDKNLIKFQLKIESNLQSKEAK